MKNNNDNALPTSPDWSTAPDWAQWFAIDFDGVGFFYHLKPKTSGLCGWECGQSIFSKSKSLYDRSNWQNSLQKRPDDV